MRKVCFIDAIGHVKERCHAKFLEGHLNELGLLIGPNRAVIALSRKLPDLFRPIRRPNSFKCPFRNFAWHLYFKKKNFVIIPCLLPLSSLAT